MARRAARGPGAVQALTALTVAAPLLVLVAALGTRSGVWSPEIGYDLLTLRVGWWLALLGGLAALGVVALSLRDVRRLAPWALAAVVIGAGTLGVFVWQKARIAAGPVENVSTDLVEVPGFGRLRAAPPGAGPGDAVGGAACPGAQPVMTQIAPESGAWALQQAGFEVRRAGVARVDGDRSSFWFGFRHDAVIRIRPGRTDIRVAARDTRSHGGEACRLATRISEALRTGR